MAANLAGIGVIAGVPLVAIGITGTQLHLEPWLETATADFLACAGLLTASLHLRLAMKSPVSVGIRLLWLLAALSLSLSMVLAGLYGLRFYIPIPWLDIPWMRVLHGTANAMGFGLAGLWGWRLEEKG